jgi:GIY-YIG catalytic domain
MGCVYIIELADGKAYIGATIKSLDARMKGHLSEAKNPFNNHSLYRAIRKFGGMTCRPLLVSNSIEYLAEMEKRVIEVFNTRWPKGHNFLAGGEGVNLLLRRYGKTYQHKDHQRI